MFIRRQCISWELSWELTSWGMCLRMGMVRSDCSGNGLIEVHLKWNEWKRNANFWNKKTVEVLSKGCNQRGHIYKVVQQPCLRRTLIFSIGKLGSSPNICISEYHINFYKGKWIGNHPCVDVASSGRRLSHWSARDSISLIKMAMQKVRRQMGEMHKCRDLSILVMDWILQVREKQMWEMCLKTASWTTGWLLIPSFRKGNVNGEK